MGSAMFLSLIGLILIRVPVAAAIGLAAMAGIAVSSLPMQPLVTAQRMFTAVDSFPFMAIPFFMLAGGIMGKGGISKRLIGLASVLAGSLRGSMGLVTIAASAFFGAISGSNPATVAAIGGIMLDGVLSGRKIVTKGGLVGDESIFLKALSWFMKGEL